jgi:hypothetical protein
MIALLLCVIAVIVPPTLQGSVQVVNLPENPVGPENCTHVCSGVQKWNVGIFYWVDSGWYSGKVYRSVDISACGFVSPPIITVTSSGGSGICPGLTVQSASIYSTRFRVYSINDVTVSDMKRIHCDINWIASGFNCN